MWALQPAYGLGGQDSALQDAAFGHGSRLLAAIPEKFHIAVAEDPAPFVTQNLGVSPKKNAGEGSLYFHVGCKYLPNPNKV
jgi:hypothetical protein